MNEILAKQKEEYKVLKTFIDDIREGEQKFILAGLKLLRIKQEEFYKLEGFNTFHEYIESKNVSLKTIYALMRIAKIYKSYIYPHLTILTPLENQPPTNTDNEFETLNLPYISFHKLQILAPYIPKQPSKLQDMLSLASKFNDRELRIEVRKLLGLSVKPKKPEQSQQPDRALSDRTLPIDIEDMLNVLCEKMNYTDKYELLRKILKDKLKAIEKQERQKQLQHLLIKFNEEKRDFENITQEDIKKWKEAYQGVNVEVELKKMKEWLIANPSRRYTNYRRFIVNWLSKAHRTILSTSNSRFTAVGGIKANYDKYKPDIVIKSSKGE